MTNFEKLVDLFNESGELGHYDELNYSITLYDIDNQPSIIESIRRRANRITKNYTLIVTDKERPTTNVKILDIDL
jgi:hypothetical protein